MNGETPKAEPLYLDDGELIVERPRAKPNPAIEIIEPLPDGTEFKAIWSHLQRSGVAKLVTVHFSTEIPHESSGERIKRTRLIQTDQ